MPDKAVDIIQNEKGFTDELKPGPMNQNNFFNYYGGSGSHTKTDVPDTKGAGTYGDFSGPPRNPFLKNPDKPGEFDNLDRQKNLFFSNPYDKEISVDDLNKLPYDFKGQQLSTQDLGGYVGVVPSNNKTDQKNPFFYSAFSNGLPKSPVTSVKDGATGFTGADGGLFETAASNAGVVQKVNKKPNGDVKGPSSGFNATRGARSARATEDINIEKTSATSGVTSVNLDTPPARRNEQSPWWDEGEGITSYTPEEKKELKSNSPFVLYMGTQPSASDRMFKVDTDAIAKGDEILPFDAINEDKPIGKDSEI